MTTGKYDKMQGHQVARAVFKTPKHNHRHIVRKRFSPRARLVRKNCHIAQRQELSQGNATLQGKAT